MNVLNPTLYAALVREFGDVRVAHQGEAMVATYSRDFGGKIWLIVGWSGEYYNVSCCFCNDTRHRLWINHKWGVPDPKTLSRHRWAAYCYNENCLSHEENRISLIRRLSWYDRTAAAGRVRILSGKLIDVGTPKPLPRDFVRLDAIKKGHPARKYVRSRGFKPDQIADRWGVGYSEDGPFPGHGVGRLVIPIYRETACTQVWGWQARTLGDLEPLPKYFNSAGLKKSTFLYGAERLETGNGPVVVCEGPTDVWRFGKNAVAILGKSASEFQINLLLRLAEGRPLVVALDGEAGDEAAVLVEQLQRSRESSILRPDSSPVLLMPLPPGRDPADCTVEELQKGIRRLLRKASV